MHLTEDEKAIIVMLLRREHADHMRMWQQAREGRQQHHIEHATWHSKRCDKLEMLINKLQG